MQVERYDTLGRKHALQGITSLYCWTEVLRGVCSLSINGGHNTLRDDMLMNTMLPIVAPSGDGL